MKRYKQTNQFIIIHYTTYLTCGECVFCWWRGVTAIFCEWLTRRASEMRTIIDIDYTETTRSRDSRRQTGITKTRRKRKKKKKKCFLPTRLYVPTPRKKNERETRGDGTIFGHGRGSGSEDVRRSTFRDFRVFAGTPARLLHRAISLPDDCARGEPSARALRHAAAARTLLPHHPRPETRGPPRGFPTTARRHRARAPTPQTFPSWFFFFFRVFPKLFRDPEFGRENATVFARYMIVVAAASETMFGTCALLLRNKIFFAGESATGNKSTSRESQFSRNSYTVIDLPYGRDRILGGVNMASGPLPEISSTVESRRTLKKKKNDYCCGPFRKILDTVLYTVIRRRIFTVLKRLMDTF